MNWNFPDDSARRKLRAGHALTLLVSAALALAACSDPGPQEVEALPGADPVSGQVAIQQYGCGTCHVIPGITGAYGTVGPPLEDWARRDFIAGQLQNTPENLVRWLQNPPAVEPGTAMPDMGVTLADARDIAAYLYTIE